MDKIATIILGGGQGTRLLPLTMTRSKPALSYGGRYRLIDIPISNAINSGCQKIFVITQFLSSSLHQHIFSTYRFSSFSSGFIELLPVQEKPNSKVWFQGTADAVRQNLDHFAEISAEYFLILSGDQLYHMDYRSMLQQAIETNADAVISCLPITEEDAKRMGVVQVDNRNFINGFHEKPQHSRDLNPLRLTPSQALRLGADPSKNLHYLASMGIYLFKRQALIDLLAEDPREDFGKHLIPTMVAKGNTTTHIHQGYWEDVGTVSSFHRANMALTEKKPQFNCYNEEWRIFASPTSLPGARLYNTRVDSAILCEGSVIEADEISHSIIGPRMVIKAGTVIKNTYAIGNDFFTPPKNAVHLPEKFQIGANSIIDKAIIDKHVYIGNNVKLINKDHLDHYDGDHVYIRDGIIVVARGANIPDGFIL